MKEHINIFFTIQIEHLGHAAIEIRIKGDKYDENSPLIERQDQMEAMDTDSAQGQIMYSVFKLLK